MHSISRVRRNSTARRSRRCVSRLRHPLVANRSEESKKQRRQYIAEWGKARRKWLTSLKAGRPCVDCGGVFHPVAMSWHHTDPATKSFPVGEKATRAKNAILA